MSDRYSLPYGVYHITPKPGLPQVAICHGFYVFDQVRGQGYGHQLMSEMTQALIAANFDYAVCTTAGDNTAMQSCLLRAGWEYMDNFHNRKTGSKHQIWHFNPTKQVDI